MHFRYSAVFYLLIIIAEVLSVGELLSGLGPKDVLQGLRSCVLFAGKCPWRVWIFYHFLNKDIIWTTDNIFIVVDSDPTMVAKPFYGTLPCSDVGQVHFMPWSCLIKGMDRPFKLRSKSRLIRSVMTNWRLGNFFYFILNGLYHKIGKKRSDAA